VAGVALRANAALTGGVVFNNLEAGRYAIILFHDENGNGRLDKNFWGVPTEPYGFSNDAGGFLGPPKFDDAAIMLDGNDKAVVTTLIYHPSDVSDQSSASEDEAEPPLTGAPMN
jgi:uncharacterized protein (DUF2141 family)